MVLLPAYPRLGVLHKSQVISLLQLTTKSQNMTRLLQGLSILTCFTNIRKCRSSIPLIQVLPTSEYSLRGTHLNLDVCDSPFLVSSLILDPLFFTFSIMHQVSPESSYHSILDVVNMVVYLGTLWEHHSKDND
uniref:Phosphotyrosyl phosphatase activator protein n=1 Tax=Solanum tuberosum TaxID=4113 RepID=M1BCR1_SOLTU